MASSNFNIIQWNCRGFRSNYEDLILLTTAHSPKIICLQETLLPTNQIPTLKNYTSYHNDNTSLLIHNSVPHTNIPLQTNLYASAARITLHRDITVCSLYIPPKYNLRLSELVQLLSQLTAPVLLLGDFNGANPLWGSSSTNPRGTLIEEFYTTNSLCLLNDKSPTFLHSSYGTFSYLDLAFTDPSLLLDFNWKVLSDLHGSDHYPILLSHSSPISSVSAQRWNLAKADWTTFSTLCRTHLSNFPISDSSADEFSKALLAIAARTIPRLSNSPTNIKKP
ncbi:endonuclease/exonuclease/phosphatase family protein, partial [Solemya velum gill symbiont]